MILEHRTKSIDDASKIKSQQITNLKHVNNSRPNNWRLGFKIQKIRKIYLRLVLMNTRVGIDLHAPPLLYMLVEEELCQG
jgi:hypothetical protein